MIYLLLFLVLLALLILFLSYNNYENSTVTSINNSTNTIPITPEENLPTLEQRVEAIELCGDLLSECQDTISYTKRGITTLQNTPISEWQKVAEENINRDKGLYWFVYRLDGVQIVQGLPLGYRPEDLTGLEDETGKNITTDILGTGESGGGWITYYWNIDIERDGITDELVKKKYSYVVPFNYQGTTYIIGAGIYLFESIAALNESCQIQSTLEHCGTEVFSECQRVMIRVGTVRSLFQDYSTERALEILKENRESFTNEEIYIYATDFNGTVLFNSLNPSAEGTNVGDDPCSQAALAHVLRCGGGWNICTFGDRVAQGLDIEATDCPTCSYEERVIIGSSFNP